MAAIVALVGPHDTRDLHWMASRLRHRGQKTLFATVNGRLSVGAIGDDPEAMIYRTDTSVTIASGNIYSLQRGREQADVKDNLACLLQSRFSAGGAKGLSTINGDFAGLICQLDGSRVVLMRDFFGCVPLFWSVLENGCQVFATEYKAIVSLSSFSPVVDRSLLQYLQAVKRMPVGRTLLNNVAGAKPGVTLLENKKVVSYENFEPIACDVRIRGEQQAKQAIAAQFRDAIALRVGSAERIGLALSGGIDSIAMAFQLRSIFPDREIHTFTAGYGEDDQEMLTAEEVARAIGSVHHPVLTPPSLIATELEKLVWHMEDPSSRSESLQLMRIGEVAADFVPALLSGQGADGLFAGMPRHKLVAWAGRFPVFRRTLLEILDLTQIGLQPSGTVGRALAALLYRGKVPPVPIVLDGGNVERPQRTAAGPDYLNRFLAAGYQNSALQDVRKFERTFAASGVDYASPCLDVSFARAAFTIDERLKIKSGTEKYIFRRAMASVVPAKFQSVPKHPQRMRYDVEFADCLDNLANELLSPSSIRSRGFFEPRSIERLRRRGAGKPYAAEAAMRLWTALATETWARLFLDNRALGHRETAKTAR